MSITKGESTVSEHLKLAECPRGQIETKVGTICWRMESADHVFLSAQYGGTVTINRVEYQISYCMRRVGGQWCKTDWRGLRLWRQMAGESSQAARAKAEEILTATWNEFINANPGLLLTAERAHLMRECKDLADKLMDARAECKRLERLINANADALESVVEKIEHKMVALAAVLYARKLNRAQHVLLLESVGIECYDSESLDTLREALIANVVDGTIDLDALA